MKWNKLILVCVLIGASFLRLYQLGSNPPSLDWDEASLGYNAYSILKTGKDEYGNSFPFSIRSFNDYKPPLYTYLAIPSIAVFGLTEQAVRLPSAIAGVIAVLAFYFLVKESSLSYKFSEELSLVSALLLAISPWHLQFSRAGFEANIALTFFIISLASFLRWQNKTSTRYLVVISAISAVASMYSYHSARLIIPVIFVSLALLHYKQSLKHWKTLLISSCVALALLVPLIVITFRGATAERFNTVSVFTNPGEFSRESERFERNESFLEKQPILGKVFFNQKLVLTQVILRNYFEHFNLDFLFLESDGNARHHSYGFGLLYLLDFPLLLLGLYRLFQTPKINKKLVLGIIAVGPIASALTASTPHAIRSLMMLPGLLVLVSIGIVWIVFEKKRYLVSAVGTFAYIILFCVYLNLYYVVSPYKYAEDWQYGYKELVNRVSSIEADYNQIIITNYYDQPHIYFAFYKQIEPSIYQKIALTAPMGFDKYTFKSIDDREDFTSEQALIVAEPERTPRDAQILDTIEFPNGEVAFNLIESKNSF